MSPIRPVSGPAPAGTHWVGPRGEIGIVTHMIDVDGLDTDDPREAVAAVIYGVNGYVTRELSRRDRRRIHLVAGSA